MEFTNRRFGVEIEFVGDRMEVRNHLLRNGVSLERWNITRDGSVRPNGEQLARFREQNKNPAGLELVSPILEGREGLEELEAVVNILDEVAEVNRTAGIHVHHEARDFTVKEFKKLFKAYYRFEGTVDSLLPKSRRGDRNQFCRSLRAKYDNIAIKKINNSKNIAEMMNVVGGDRYVKLNFAAYRTKGTVEFRQHSSSTEAKKIIHWVKLTQAFMERAVDEQDMKLPSNFTDNWDRMKVALRLSKDRAKSEEYKKIVKYYNKRRKELAA